ncbi:glycoside hydrolase family 10 protein [Bacillus testis]|uniref:glycoside hydrolase family 10 protein n=1 Tax=Bacillus testis TaxID=1622072 RepID=UPI00067E7827|nr:family 10 glycosylhydrolase [Bacillus testis]
MGKKSYFTRVGFLLTLSLVLLFSILPAETQAAKPMPKAEMRAAWIATVQNIDMKAGMSKPQFTAWSRQTLDQLKKNRFNTVIFQVKPTNDSLYPSKLSPWSSFATGKKQGTNPGYDPLLIMTEEAHKRGMELHAWVNPYRVTMPGQPLSSLARNNIAVLHPEWVVKYGQQYYLNPGIPEVQDYLIAAMQELVSNYDIDAVHMDDYFYPYKIKNQSFPDQAAFKEYGQSYTKIEDWRRDNVTQLVGNLYSAIKGVKPWVQFGISPFGVWRNKSLDKTGSDTKAGVNNYDDLYADTRQWIKNGSIDYVTPQIYWSRSLSAANYSTLVSWWANEIKQYAKARPVNLYIGLADYKVNNDSDKAWRNKMELANQISMNRGNAYVKGQMHFSLKNIQKNALGYMSIVKQQMYMHQALTPAFGNAADSRPPKPATVKATANKSGINLSISGQSQNQPRKYAIYRFLGNKAGSIQSPAALLDVVYNQSGVATYIDSTAQAGKTYTYGVTSLSPYGLESLDAIYVQAKR